MGREIKIRESKTFIWNRAGETGLGGGEEDECIVSEYIDDDEVKQAFKEGMFRVLCLQQEKKRTSEYLVKEDNVE